ncbi:MAG: fatty acid desaturase, partial [Alphaproteobacteria bacterium]|nr:fatty acid desaturase [Alphaproteobacteria bacterium]
LSGLLRVLRDPKALRGAKKEIGADLRAFAKTERAALQPSWALGGWSLVRTLGLVAGATTLTAWSGSAAVAALLTPICGAALFGVSSLVHDAAHGTLLPSSEASRRVGRLLAPLVWLDFESFRASHVGHHRQSQSYTKDPKNPRVPRPTEGGGVDAALGIPAWATWPLRAWSLVARQVLRLPPTLRHLFYAASLLLLGLPIVLGFGGEVSLRQRDWSARGPWLSLAASCALTLGLFVASPLVGAFFLASTWVAMGLFFGVFLTHLTPFQLYPEDENPAVTVLALNVSDLRSGWLIESLGNRFTEFHAAHHLLPYVPSYHLAKAGAWVDARFADRKAPVFDLRRTEHFNLIGDTLVLSLTRAAGASLVAEPSAVGTLFRMRMS